MLEFFATLHWGAVIQIIVIDVLLGGDNAVVIALACRNLPPSQRTKGVLWGTASAIVLRVALIAFAVVLLDVPLLKFAGGLLLLWIGVRLMAPAHDVHENVKPADKLISAIRTIIIADAVMSLDNVIAIAGAAESADPEHRITLVIFGLLVSIPLIVWGSQLVLKLLDRFPIVVTLGAALLGWIAGGLIINDLAGDRWPILDTPAAEYGMSVACTLFVVLAGYALKRRNANRAQA
ncbi:MAG: Membrane protein TerC, possibly involved in tellurium resistance [uncultured Paraburkholderia sp.]|nr:MAG: Membrane protein TerC, possibly involved in tellurium resistance [uncultured Paraburkholderia sp.]CAH2935278.1 MAG: Membrane protein TerC, possibly involved in tellurium resistance [uncultured Paraburkholderia sp.]